MTASRLSSTIMVALLALAMLASCGGAPATTRACGRARRCRSEDVQRHDVVLPSAWRRKRLAHGQYCVIQRDGDHIGDQAVGLL